MVWSRAVEVKAVSAEVGNGDETSLVVPPFEEEMPEGDGGGVVVVVSGVNGVYNAVEESRMVVAPTESASAGRSN